MAWKDPEIVAVRDLLAATRAANPPAPMTFAERRPGMDALAVMTPLPAGCAYVETTLGGRPSEIVTPAGADTTKVLLYLHGGGYCLGSPTSHRGLVARIAAAAGVVAHVPHYRLGPEDPFPAAVDDGLAAYRQLLDAGMLASRIVIGGDSAGGGLTFATALAAKAAGLPQPAGLFVISPWANLANAGAAYAAKTGSDPMLTKESLDEFAAGYLGGKDAGHPLASPVNGDVTGLAPVLIQVGGEEVLLSDAVTMAEKLGLAGGDVTLRIWPEMIHVWHFFAAQLAAGRAASDEAAAWIRARLA
jgi:monoterpene epsilon-lactone hydrolase